MATLPLLIGELNPYNADPRLALWPSPRNSAGGRLCYKILGLTKHEYLRRFQRANLCTGVWLLEDARAQVEVIRTWDFDTAILLGAKVCSAFRLPFVPFGVQTSILGPRRETIILPHPSGRCRVWNDPGSVERVQNLLQRFLVP